MKIFLRLYVVGCMLIFFISCQIKAVTTPLPLEGKPKLLSLANLFLKIKVHQSNIRDIKAFVSTNISGDNLNQTFRQALFVKGDESIRVETYNLFRQVLGVLIYKGGKTLMYDPKTNRVVHGEEVWDIMRRMTGSHFDLRKYISVFLGGIPRFSSLQAKSSNWNIDKTVYKIETVDQETGEQVIIKIDAYTHLPKSVHSIQNDQEIYRVRWEDYRKVDQWDFAHKVTITFSTKNEIITVKYSDIYINQGFAPDAFKLSSEFIH